MLRVLLCAFYFPPAGGGGVERPLKFAAHLSALGIEMHVLAPDDPRWIHRDVSLAPPAGVRVHRVRYLGARGRLPAEELFGHRGLDRARRWLVLLPRRLLVPDENVLWNLTAVPAAIRIVCRERIDVVITTSPPGSLHLLGALVQRATGVCWVADLRDSLVANPNRSVERRAARLKERLQGRIASLVARYADGTVAVTETIAAEQRRLAPASSVAVIPNGCDFEDFDGIERRPSTTFRITHTGSFFGKRDPRPFLSALATSRLDVVARFVGDFRAADKEWANTIGLGARLQLLPFTTHQRALELQRDSEALLLLLPEVGARGHDVPSGKLYEYLAAGRPILAAVPPQGSAAALVREADAGIVVDPDDIDAITAALQRLVQQWQTDQLADVHLEPGLRARLARSTRARELADFLEATRAARASTAAINASSYSGGTRLRRLR